MITGWFWMTAACAALDWIATWRCWQRIRWITKPGTLVLLIVWFTQVGGWRGALLWFGLGLVASLAGDILLHLPSQFFLPGVGAFFLAHLFYIIGFWQQPLQVSWIAVLAAAGVALIYWAYTRRIRAGLRRQGATGLQTPVMVYAAALSLMWLSALLIWLRPGWAFFPAALASLGASLFFFSDATMAYSRFVRAFPQADFVVMVSYHAGQILIAAGVLAQALGYTI